MARTTKSKKAAAAAAAVAVEEEPKQKPEVAEAQSPLLDNLPAESNAEIPAEIGESPSQNGQAPKENGEVVAVTEPAKPEGDVNGNQQPAPSVDGATMIGCGRGGYGRRDQ